MFKHKKFYVYKNANTSEINRIFRQKFSGRHPFMQSPKYKLLIYSSFENLESYTFSIT